MSQKAETPSIRHSRADIWSFVIFFGFVIVIVFLIYPLFDIFRYSFMDKKTQTFSLSNWKTFFSKVYYLRAFWHSIVIAILTTFFSMVLGIPLAFFTTRYRIKGANLLNTLSVLALLSPTFIGAYSWITMLGRAGALMTIDRSLEEASENLGARSIKTFFSVTLPLVLPSVTGGALIVFMMSLSNFGTPMIIGGNYLVLPTLAYNLYTSEISQTPGMASTVSIILMLCASVVIVLQQWVSSRRKYASMLVNRPVIKQIKGIKSVLARAMVLSFSRLFLLL